MSLKCLEIASLSAMVLGKDFSTQIQEFFLVITSDMGVHSTQAYLALHFVSCFKFISFFFLNFRKLIRIAIKNTLFFPQFLVYDENFKKKVT